MRLKLKLREVDKDNRRITYDILDEDNNILYEGAETAIRFMSDGTPNFENLKDTVINIYAGPISKDRLIIKMDNIKARG